MKTRSARTSRRTSRSLTAIGGTAAILFSTIPAAHAYDRPSRTEILSMSPDGSQGNAASGGDGYLPGVVMTPDARFIAFDTQASNLGVADPWGTESRDIILVDRQSDVRELVTVATDGTASNGRYAHVLGISDDGQRVVFRSTATDLAPNDTNGAYDIFVRNRVAQATERVSVREDGAQANGRSLYAAISGDGDTVVFSSEATNLDPQGRTGTFVRDLAASTTSRLGQQVPGSVAIDGDGRFVAAGGSGDVVLYDRSTGDVETISVAVDGGLANGTSESPFISADGRFVAFHSEASNLVHQDTNLRWDVFVRDRLEGETELISFRRHHEWTSAAGIPADSSRIAGMSADGRYISFKDELDGSVYVHDRAMRAIELVTATTDGDHPRGRAAGGTWLTHAAPISNGGRYVGFDSEAENLANVTAEDQNGFGDVFLLDRGPELGIGSLSAHEAGPRIEATGWATFTGGPVLSVTDPSDDGEPGSGELGGELTGVEATYRHEDASLLVRFDVDDLAGVGGPGYTTGRGFVCNGSGGIVPALGWGHVGCAPSVAGKPDVYYEFGFWVGSARYELRAIRTYAYHALLARPWDEAKLEPEFLLFKCANPSQDRGCGLDVGLYEWENPQIDAQAEVTGEFGTTGSEILVSLPLKMVGASQGTVIRPYRALVSIGDGAGWGPVLDDIVELPEIEIPTPRVSLALAPEGEPEPTTFPLSTHLVYGMFDGSLPTAGLDAADYDVWAQTCLGDDCSVTRTPVAIHSANG